MVVLNYNYPNINKYLWAHADKNQRLGKLVSEGDRIIHFTEFQVMYVDTIPNRKGSLIPLSLILSWTQF